MRKTGELRLVATPTEGSPTAEPEWRREVSSRLRSYRVRRHGAAATDLQPALPFEQIPESPVEAPDSGEAGKCNPSPTDTTSPRNKKPPADRFVISLHETPPAGAERNGAGLSQPRGSSAPDVPLSVASLSERRRAAILDATLLLFSYGGMLALFAALGGRLEINKIDAAVTGATLMLFYAQYYALFTIFGGSTPGMMLRGIRVVSFDGSIPTSRQMAWRSFGYIISAATCFLGFLWAIWDEDHLCWQDRISQTYLTPIDEITMPRPSFGDTGHRQ
jgi:uncharacterized RDD family membrane protein YckC